MKINITSRIEAAAASGKTFEEQLAEAEASGKPFGTVVDWKLGKQVIYHTAEEIAHFAERAAEESAKPKPKSAGMLAFEAIKQDPQALAALKAELAK